MQEHKNEDSAGVIAFGVILIILTLLELLIHENNRQKKVLGIF